MGQKSDPQPRRVMGPGPADSECLVSWVGMDDQITSIGPFPRTRAELLVQVYGRMYPSQTCWVEALPPAVGGLHLGRARRHVAIPRLAAPDGEH